MHKFFCSFNNLTEKYELSLNRGSLFPSKASTLSETNLMESIKNDIQSLYDNIVELKNLIKNEDDLNVLDETELLISNLYYSFFASPMEINEKEENQKEIKELLLKSIELGTSLDKQINIPEYNRLVKIIVNNLQNILNKLK